MRICPVSDLFVYVSSFLIKCKVLLINHNKCRFNYVFEILFPPIFKSF